MGHAPQPRGLDRHANPAKIVDAGHEDVKTPLAALKQHCDKGLARLKEGVTLAALQATADAQTDLAAAQEMQRAKTALFQLFNSARARVNKAA